MGIFGAIVGGLIAAILVAVIAVRALGGNIMLVDDWRKSWKWYSTWAFMLVAFLPDLLNGLMVSGFVDGTPISEQFNLITKAVCGFAFFLRNVRQVKAPPPPVFDHTKPDRPEL